ncbi:MAG: recombination protein RecR [Phycisphaerales bacterium]|nr:recombination protein RecR [Phycisphaerales bacterium]
MSEQRLSGPLQRLIDELRRLPGVGARSAERIAFHILKTPAAEALGLAQTIRDIKEKIRPCKVCFNLADEELCDVCRDGRRDASVIVVVEQPKDLLTLESTGLIAGVYHVLMGRIAPLEGIGPEDLTIRQLLERVKTGGVREVLLATNPTLEGDATALYISNALQGKVKLTRLARGLAPGGQIEYANRTMLEEALKGRREVD